MKVQTSYSQYISGQGQPAFGNYVIDKRIARAVGKNVPKNIKTFYALGKNNGENLNNTVTAIGTAGVAPIFIRFNPLSDEDPKVKAYSALRQPLSAVLALGVQLPVMTAYNYLLDKWAASGKVRRIDLSAKPPESIVRTYAKSRYNQELREFFAAGNTVDDLEAKFYKGRTKGEYIEDIMQEARNNIFYAQRDKMRRLAKENQPITTSVLRDENGKVKDWFHPTKLSEIKDIEFVKPDELDKARKDVYSSVLKEFGINPDDKKLFNIKIDWEDPNALEKHKQMKNGEKPEGSIVIWEYPIKDPPFGLYIAGCLPPGEKVLTQRGLINVEDVTLDDKLVSKNGNYVNIHNLQRYWSDGNLYKIKVANTYRTTSFTDEHPIYVSDTLFGEYKFVKAKNIKVGQYTKVPNLYYNTNEYIDAPYNSIGFWWLVGLWLGDGWCDSKKHNVSIVFDEK